MEEWISHLLHQDIANLSVHLRTRKEMSKVDAHWEVIPKIIALRDQIAPQTLITINGDIPDRRTGEELAEKYGVDGIMIGRGFSKILMHLKKNRGTYRKRTDWPTSSATRSARSLFRNHPTFDHRTASFL